MTFELAWVDAAIIAAYFVVVIGLGLWFQKKAAENVESYFLGGKSIHWLALAMSGSVSNFDITGTMWIVSLLFVLGMKSMWIHWMWGWVIGAFCLAYMGQWVRRSNVLTAAEWMVTRFGDGTSGKTARTAYALMAVVTQASFVGYAFLGVGKFAAVYLPFSATTCALLIIGTTTFYVLVGGLYSVVVTDVIQTIILSFAGILIAAIAYSKVSPELLATVLPEGWASIRPTWELPELAGTDHEVYQFFGVLCIVWVAKGLFLNAGGPAQMYDFQRFLATKDPRDAAKVGASWSLFLVVRWGMAMGIALLALTGFGGDRGAVDAEQIMPIVLQEHLPLGIRGLVIAGLLAAFMSTFSSTVNSGASFIVRDLWVPFARREPSQRQQIVASYWATGALVGVGVGIGLSATSISEIWNWMMMALGAGVIVPNVLRWYWWRLNGWGYACGTLAGIALALIALVFPSAPLYVVFPAVVAASLVTSVIASLATAPVAPGVLVRFYENVRPFGAWGPVRAVAKREAQRRSAARPIFNTVIAMVGIVAVYLLPMYLVGHWMKEALLCGTIFATAIAVLYLTWYRHLPAAEAEHDKNAVSLEEEDTLVSPPPVHRPPRRRRITLPPPIPVEHTHSTV